MSEIGVSRPARPRRLKFEFEREGDRLTMTRRSREWALGLFLLLWLLGWTVGCVALAVQVFNDPQPRTLLFAVPFWSSWLFVCGLIVAAFARREEFTLDAGGVAFESRAVVTLQTRSVPLAEIHSFGTWTIVGSEDARQYGIEMRTLGRPVHFGKGLPEPERSWLLVELNGHLAELHDRAEPGPWRNAETTAVVRDDGTLVETVELAEGRFVPPSDCTWTRRDDFDSMTFEQRGRWQLGTVLGLLFVNAFWNGIVGVFVTLLCGGGAEGPQGGMWWGMLVFLIPFEVIGLAMLVGLAAAVFEPVRRTSWEFGRDEVRCRIAWCGWGCTWRYPVDQLDRVELRQIAPNTTAKNLKVEGFSHGNQQGGTRFELSLVDAANTECCRLAGLTEGEGRWIADGVLRDKREWFAAR